MFHRIWILDYIFCKPVNRANLKIFPYAVPPDEAFRSRIHESMKTCLLKDSLNDQILNLMMTERNTDSAMDKVTRSQTNNGSAINIMIIIRAKY